MDARIAETATGDHSEARERLRAAKASIAKMDLEARRGNMIPRGVLDSGLTELAVIGRAAGEKIDRIFGADALALFNGSLSGISWRPLMALRATHEQ